MHGVGNVALTAPKVFIDDTLRCENPRCELTLAPGTHFVRAEAQGFLTTAPQAVKVQGGQTAVYNFSLLPSAQQAVGFSEIARRQEFHPVGDATASASADARVSADGAAENSNLQPSPDQVVTITDLPAVSPPAPNRVIHPPSKLPGATGRLSFNSIPPSSVLLDGRPLGGTPRANVRVTPGTYTVTFVHPKHGRKNITVKIASGANKSVSVRF